MRIFPPTSRPTQPWNLPRNPLTEIALIIPAIRTPKAKSPPDCCRNVALVYPAFTTFGVGCRVTRMPRRNVMRANDLSPTSAALGAYDRAVAHDKGTGKNA